MIRSRLRALILTTLLALGGLTACDGGPFSQSCTLIGCLDSLSVRLVQSSGPLPDGGYVLTITDNANGDARTCTLELRAGALVGQAGCSTGVEANTVGFFDFVPTDATLTFADASATVAEATVAIAYTTSQPNGPDCGPTCYQSAPVDFELAP